MSAQFHGDFFAVKHKRFLLKIGLPNFLGMTHRKADVASVLLTFAGDFTFLHLISLYLSQCSKSNYRVFAAKGQGCNLVLHHERPDYRVYYYSMYSFGDPISILLILGVIFVSTAFHELMHAYVALKLGDDLAHSKGRISLNPLRHIDPFLTVFLPLMLMLLGSQPILAAKPVPININRLKGRENGLALVGVIGPLTNLAIACIASLVVRNVVLTGIFADIVAYFFFINLGLFIFNMIPLPPLDGSRVLYAVAPEPVRRIMEQIESYGVIVIILFVSLFYGAIGPLLFKWQQELTRLLLG